MLKRKKFMAGGALFNRMLDCAEERSIARLPEGDELREYAEVFADNDLVSTCFCLFENDLNVSRTADRLYMHRNTLIYRIRKLKRLTGLDVRTFADAVTFIILYRGYCGEEGINARK